MAKCILLEKQLSSHNFSPSVILENTKKWCFNVSYVSFMWVSQMKNTHRNFLVSNRFAFCLRVYEWGCSMPHCMILTNLLIWIQEGGEEQMANNDMNNSCVYIYVCVFICLFIYFYVGNIVISCYSETVLDFECHEWEPWFQSLGGIINQNWIKLHPATWDSQMPL